MKDDPNNESLERATNTVVPALEKIASPVTRIPVRNPDVARTGDQKVRDVAPPLPPRDTATEVTVVERARALPPQIPEIQARISGGSSGGSVGQGGSQGVQFATMLAQLALINARLDDLEDDFPEPIMQGGGGGGGGVWSGRVWFGGSLVRAGPVGEIYGTHISVNLRTGSTDWEDWDEMDEGDLADKEFYSVATKFVDAGPPEKVSYALNNHTCGDIRCRIT